MEESKSRILFFKSGEKIGKKQQQQKARGVNISGPNTLKQRQKIYKGGGMEKDTSRLLILASQNKSPTSFVNTSYLW